MNTPLQTFIEYIEQKREDGEGDLRTLIWKGKELLEKEKQMICDAYVAGFAEALKNKPMPRTDKDYYQQTFKTTP